MRAALLLALAIGNTMAAEPPAMGRLFLTPQQRQQIDHERRTSSALGASVIIDGEIRQGGKHPLQWSRASSEWLPASLPQQAPIGDAYQPSTAEIRPLLGDGRLTIHPARVEP